ncbi:4a-hydroxytetrahydrobiopterin dehydratase [Cellulomonas uda]|uniref:Putative pterin-4-alpha-carbinolamine dehydratase n=1 Tax=Cellulomonas uda TaxID=1714 RepID=A0A4Y3K793_CELUD|nr:4a-hydroxytetrahydrobiopterin dehydratase [Cellulomonas uda]NII67407.1 4a-hydroxytetrahydrobiopterin dehydratase [Cellulomonas uda]GEA79873.1 hypothetical protein CUD01_03170 [Cellulomonas uda]
MDKLTGQQIADAGLTGWVYLPGGLHTRIATGDFAAGLALVDRIGAAAQEQDHHPDLDLRYAFVDVRLTSHDAGGVTDADVRLARDISRFAADAGHQLRGAERSLVELALDSPDHAEVRGFYTAALAYTGEDDLSDPAGALPTVWFQWSGTQEPRQRWHLDVWVDPGEVQPRIDAALAAGGRLVDDSHAPSFWVLADAQGNRLCLCTWQER